MKPPAIRITAVPRSGHPNSGLQAMHFAERYGDEVWALPAPGHYLGEYPVRFFWMDNGKPVIPVGLLRRAFICWSLILMLVRPGRFYIIHNVAAAIPAWLLRRRYSVFIHGSDRLYLDRWWGRALARSATDVFGVGFGVNEPGLTVTEVSNIFVPAPLEERQIEYDALFVLRNAPVKNPCFPIELAENLDASLDAGIAVAGMEEDELPPDYRRRLAGLQKRGFRVSYLGRMPYSDLVELMRKSRTLIMPSFAEGLPKALLEALSQGMQVAANKALSFPPSLSSCVDFIDLQDWASISKLLEKNRSVGRNEGHKRVAEDYLRNSQNALSAIYDDIYERHLGFVPSPNRLVAT